MNHKHPLAEKLTISVRSDDADRTVLPSAERSQAVTQSECPSNVSSSLPVARSHFLSVLSLDAVMAVPVTKWYDHDSPHMRGRSAMA